MGLTGAEDVVADALATVFARWGDAPASLDEQRAWAFGITHHKLQEAFRKRSRAIAVVSVLHAGPTASAAADDEVAALDRARRLLERLPTAERNAVYLTVVAGLTSAETARILECSVTAVTSRVSRARHSLRAILEAEKGKEASARVVS